MSDIEAVGDALTGSALGQVVEPGAGETSADGPVRRGKCLNCGAQIRSVFCGACGQKRNVHRTIPAIGHELMHAIMHLDGKLWRTLPLLAWHPGELTRRYVHGERAKFVSPLATFLFSIFLMFAVLQVDDFSPSGEEMVGPAQVRDVISQLQGNLEAKLEELHDDRTEAVRIAAAGDGLGSQRLASIDKRITDTRQEIAKLGQLRLQATQLRIGNDGPNMQIGLGSLGGGNYVLEEFDRNPRLALYKLQSNSSKFSWLLIPISVPFVWLLFCRSRRFRFYDHTVFVTYSMAFMSLLAVLLTAMDLVGVHVALIAVAGIVIPPIHMHRQLKHAYGLGRLAALMRTIALLGFCLVIAVLYLVFVLSVSG